MKTYILDTNIILDNIENVFKLYNNENRIVIPDIVIDELDSKKSQLDELGYSAREFARTIDSMNIKEIRNSGKYTITFLEGKNLKLEIISKEVYEVNENNTSKNILNDRKIIECIHYYKEKYNDVIFVSLDTMCRIRATSEGIEAQTLGIKDNSEKEIQFSKEIYNDFAYENMDISVLDPEYKPHNFNYLIRENDGKTILGYVVNQKLNIINEENLNKQDIKPQNINQKFYVSQILDDRISIVLSDSIAGSGKTLLAISTAMRLINEKKYNKIVYIRNSIESLDSGEDVGYLSTNEVKFAVYNHPLYDNISYIAEKQLQRSNENKSNSKKCQISKDKLEEKIQELIKRYDVETMWIGELRGRTISNAVVIIDEFQNMSRKSALTTLSRIDKTCKVIVTGSNKQIDNPYVNKYINGMSILLKATQELHPEINISAVNLTKVLRGPITEFAERVFKI